MPTGKFPRFLLSGLIVVALALGGYWLIQGTQPEKCRICRREIPAQARAVVHVHGKPEPVCCARCAFTFAQQKHTPIRSVEVTDYVSTKSLAPGAAYYVEGSRVVLCEKHEPLVDETKPTQARVFDRCELSLNAFAQREDAAAFARENGGQVRRLPELLQEVEAQPQSSQ